MIVKIIIPCWPDFKSAAQPCLRESLLNFAGEACLIELDKGIGNGYGFKYEGITFNIFASEYCYLSTARNLGANSFSGLIKIHQKICDSDRIQFIDADTGFTNTDILALIDENVPVIGGGYKYRMGVQKGKFVAGYWDELGLIKSIVDSNETGITKVDWVGAGFLLVKSSVFEKIKYPWFHCGVIEKNDEAYELGEDIAFCRKCSNEGIQILVHCGLNLTHRDLKNRSDKL